MQLKFRLMMEENVLQKWEVSKLREFDKGENCGKLLAMRSKMDRSPKAGIRLWRTRKGLSWSLLNYFRIYMSKIMW